MENNHINELLGDVLASKGSVETTRQVVKWMATPEGQLHLDRQMDTDLLQGKFSQTVVSPSTDLWKKIMKRRSGISFKQRTYFRYIAAALIPFLLLVGGISLYRETQSDLGAEEEWVTVDMPRGKYSQVVFQDGTIVYLGPESHLSYPRKFSSSQRAVRFSGEAYFEVAKNPECPFVIQMNDVSLKVLGTSFNVMANPGNSIVQVRLDEGKIQMSSLFDSQMEELSAGMSATYDKTSRRLSKGKSSEIEGCMANWKSDKLSFRNASMEDVLHLLERRYDTRFQIKNDLIRSYHYTVSFQDESLNKIMEGMSSITPIKFIDRGAYIEVDAK